MQDENPILRLLRHCHVRVHSCLCLKQRKGRLVSISHSNVARCPKQAGGKKCGEQPQKPAHTMSRVSCVFHPTIPANRICMIWTAGTRDAWPMPLGTD